MVVGNFIRDNLWVWVYNGRVKVLEYDDYGDDYFVCSDSVGSSSLGSGNVKYEKWLYIEFEYENWLVFDEVVKEEINNGF